MVKYCTGEGRGAVAHTAVLGRRQVINQLADRNHIVVTALTAIRDTGMIENAGRKGTCSMADAAIIGGRQMVWRLASRFSRNTRVTSRRRAIVHDTGMVEDGIRKAHRIMAYAAILGGDRVIGRHPDRIDAVVAVMTVCAGLR